MVRGAYVRPPGFVGLCHSQDVLKGSTVFLFGDGGGQTSGVPSTTDLAG